MEERKLKPEIVESEDGSHTLRVAELKEHYHSHKGAIQESQYVFLKMGLKAIESENIRLLEVGFGTGLNALMTLLQNEGKSIHYVALEPFPLEPALLAQLNHADRIGSGAQEAFKKLHESPWAQATSLEVGFTLEKHKLGLEQYHSDDAFDLVYYDAFAPHAQPELWLPSIWQQLFGLMKPGGVLVTYCAKGQVRRDMQSAGFKVERLPGPPGKREMLRARKE